MPTAIAIAAHPDDIEFVMAGTLLLLGAAGWELHYMNLSSGNLGSTTMTPARTARVRRREAQAAAKRLGAAWHAPICNDMGIFYEDRALRRLGGVIREAAPDVILRLAAGLQEDHTSTCRLACQRRSSARCPIPDHAGAPAIVSR
jgi:LmbE family N-acetylglucosaminyl deacetylase